MTLNHQEKNTEINAFEQWQLGTPMLTEKMALDPEKFAPRARNEGIRFLKVNGAGMTQERSDKIIWYYTNPRNGGQEDSPEDAAWREYIKDFTPRANRRLVQPNTIDPNNAQVAFNLICCANSAVSVPIFMTDLRRWNKKRNLSNLDNNSPDLRLVLAPRKRYRRVVEEFFNALYFQYIQEPINGLAIVSSGRTACDPAMRMLACAVFQSQETITMNRAAHNER